MELLNSPDWMEPRAPTLDRAGELSSFFLGAGFGVRMQLVQPPVSWMMCGLYDHMMTTTNLLDLDLPSEEPTSKNHRCIAVPAKVSSVTICRRPGFEGDPRAEYNTSCLPS